MERLSHVLTWRPQYRLRTPHRFSVRNLMRQALGHRADGHDVRAYKLASAVERYMVRHGEQMSATRLSEFIATLGPTLLLPRPKSIADLASAAERASAGEHWADALGYLEEILAREPKNPGVRFRTLAHRSTALHVLGYLTRALESYDALLHDPAVWQGQSPEYRVRYHASRETVAWHLGQAVDVGRLTDAVPYLARSPHVWASYWWLLAHEAWRKNPDRVPGVRRSSIRSFGLDWPAAWDSALWGMDLLDSPDLASDAAERRVRRALSDPGILHVIGRSAWFDLYGDWLTYLLTRQRQEASGSVEEFMEWCLRHGYPGWAEHWQTPWTEHDGG